MALVTAKPKDHRSPSPRRDGEWARITLFLDCEGPFGRIIEDARSLKATVERSYREEGSEQDEIRCTVHQIQLVSSAHARTHAQPGQFVRMEILEPLGLSVPEAARALGVTRAALSALLNGRASLSPDMALRVETAFGPTMATLLRMQGSYDMAEARDRAGDIQVKRYVVTSRRARAALAQV